MFVLFTILEPQVKIYLVDHNHFSTFKAEAMKFETRESAMEVQSQFPFDLQIEKSED